MPKPCSGLLTRGFGPLPADLTRRVQAAAQPEFDLWLDRILDAKSVAAVFEGRAEGRTEGQAHALLRQLTSRFGPLPANLTQRVQNATQPELDLWLVRILDAKRLAAVFEA